MNLLSACVYTRLRNYSRTAMVDSAHALDVLFRKENALWRPETQHEAMLLLKTVYRADTKARDEIITAILAGPPQKCSEEEGSEGVERHIFEMLAFLDSESLSLPTEAQEKLAEIRRSHPEWKPKEHPGMSVWFEMSW